MFDGLFGQRLQMFVSHAGHSIAFLDLECTQAYAPAFSSHSGLHAQTFSRGHEW